MMLSNGLVIGNPDKERGTVSVRGKCKITGNLCLVNVSSVGVQRWLGGALIQDALPDSTKEEREFLTSAISPDGWNALFSNHMSGADTE
jgi:hypothetical protein